jgi:hypothetical protein
MELNAKKAVFLLVLLLATNAGAVTVDFSCITNNDTSGSSCAIAELQMDLNVESVGNERVLFTFSNTGTIDSFITDVYFMYEGLDFLTFNSILNSDSGVSFSESAHPAYLPGHDSSLASFSAGSDSGNRHGYGKGSYGKGNHGRNSSHFPAIFRGYGSEDTHARRGGRDQNGINPGESLSILFDLNDAVYDNALAALNNGDLVIGVHAQGLGEGDEFSESLITATPAVVPLPAAVWLFGSGLLALFGLLKRSSR